MSKYFGIATIGEFNYRKRDLIREGGGGLIREGGSFKIL